MTDMDYLKPALAAWKQACLLGDIKTLHDEHIGDDEFYELAVPGGIDQASEKTIDHISSCPLCLEKWGRWRNAISDTIEDDSGKEQVLSYGMLKAAAGKEQKESVNIHSNCGRFMLGIYPDKNNHKKAMVVLEFVEGAALEGKAFVVRDNQGNVIVDGRLRQGRVARICDDIESLDLSKWTLVEKPEQKINNGD